MKMAACTCDYPISNWSFHIKCRLQLWIWFIKEDQLIKNFKPEPYFELNTEIFANQQKFEAKLDPYQRFKDESGLMTFMQAKHVKKGLQDGLIKGVQKQGKKRVDCKFNPNVV